MRVLTEVIGDIIKVIPPELTVFIHQLESTLLSAYYAAPESQPGWWVQSSSILKVNMMQYSASNDATNPVFEDGSWQQKVLDIWAEAT